MDTEEIHSGKRFRHESYASTLKTVHVVPSTSTTHLDEDLDEHESHFYAALQQQRQLNLAPAFIRFANGVERLTQTLPLLLLNVDKVIGAWIEAVEQCQEGTDEGLKALLDIMSKLTFDLRSQLKPSFEQIYTILLSLLKGALSSTVLTLVFSTLSTLLRYIIPPTAAEIGPIYDSFVVAVRGCNYELQRAGGEVLGSVLRRLKGDERMEAVGMLFASTKSGDGVLEAWAMVSACKGVSQSLHGTASSLFQILLDVYLENSDDSLEGETLLRRTLTALIHHVTNADGFDPISSCLVGRFTLGPNGGKDPILEDREFLKITNLTRIICEVRKGSRVSPSQFDKLLKHLTTLPLHVPFLHLGIAILSTTSSATPSSSSFAYVNYVLNSVSSTSPPSGAQLKSIISFTASLADLQYPHLKSMIRPLILKHLSCFFSSDNDVSKELLHLLGTLNEAGLIAGARPESLPLENVLSIVDKTESSEQQAINLYCVVSAAQLLAPDKLSSFLSAEVTHRLQSLCDAAPDRRLAAETEFTKQWFNSGWVIGKCLRILAPLPAASDFPQFQQVFTRIIQMWGWNTWVIQGLQELFTSHTNEFPISLDDTEIKSILTDNVMHHSHDLRLSSLRLLSHWESFASSSDSTKGILEILIKAESIPISLSGVRERVLKIQQLGMHAKSKEDAILAAKWLIAQLKVNLKPLWVPAIQALSSFSDSFPDCIWSISYSQLKIAENNDVRLAGPQPDWLGETVDVNRVDSTWQEDEQTWRDGHAFKVETALRRMYDIAVEQKIQARIMKEQSPCDKLDVANYTNQLLRVLVERPVLLQKHQDILTPLFIDTCPVVNPPRSKLISWLEAYSKLKVKSKENPPPHFLPLYDLFLAHLSFPDLPIQSHAMACVLNFQSQYRSEHSSADPMTSQQTSQLKNLLNDKLWREELVNFKDAAASGDIRDTRSDFASLLVRVLFGIIRDRRRGGGGGKNGDVRRSCLRLLESTSGESELQLLVQLMIHPFCENDFLFLEGFKTQDQLIAEPLPLHVTDRQQLGYLVLLEDILKILGRRISEAGNVLWRALFVNTIRIIATAQKQLDMERADYEGSPKDADDDDIDHQEDLGKEQMPSRSGKSSRSIRQLGIKRLIDFSRVSPILDLSPYLAEAFKSFISPRLTPMFPKENSHSPSAMLELFVVWSSTAEHAEYLVRFNSHLLSFLYGCLGAIGVKSAVVSKIFDLIENLLRSASEDVSGSFTNSCILPYLEVLLKNSAAMIGNNSSFSEGSDPIGRRHITILSQLASYCHSPAQALGLIQLFLGLLRKPSKVMPEKSKADILVIYTNVFPLVPELSVLSNPSSLNGKSGTDIFEIALQTLGSLFQSLRSRAARINLVSAFCSLCSLQLGSWKATGEILADLNSFSERRPDEPDFDKRLKAFALFNENVYQNLPPEAWPPFLYNMFNFIQDTEELSLRINASASLKRFVDRLATDKDKALILSPVFNKVFLPGLKNGLRTKSEVVRTELLGVLHYAVVHCKDFKYFQDMQVLLAGGDEEANFFNNIHHIQVHRRTRALRRLSEICDGEAIRSSVLSEIFIPLIGNFVQNSEIVDHTLANEAISCLGHMAHQLTWRSYSTLVQYYLKLGRAGGKDERVNIRALVSILENFHFSMEEVVDSTDDIVDPETDVLEPPTSEFPRVSDVKKISDSVSQKLLPSLLDHLDKRGEVDDSLRIPIAIGIVRLAQHLPAQSREAQVTRLLTILSQVFRSKSQDTRDLVRDTLCRIAVILGGDYFHLIIRELRAALLRGPHLHILATVVHALLVHVSTPEHSAKFQYLDECAGDVAHLSAEVIFGRSGQEAMSDGFKPTIREVRGSAHRAMDSFMIVSRFISPQRISVVLHPLRAIMHETESLKVMDSVDDVLKKIATGLTANSHLGSLELLVLCHTLINGNAKFLQQVEKPSSVTLHGKKSSDDYAVQLKRKDLSSDHYATNSFRFVALGLDLLGTAFRRSRFDLQDRKTISQLEPMVAVLGNCLYSSAPQVLILALRATSFIVKFSLEKMKDALPVLVRQIMSIIKVSGSAESDTVQAALKTLAVIIRDCPGSSVKEDDHTFLLELLTPDVEEPNRQSTVFGLLRAIVSRKFVVPEIYDLMDRISEIMVTSQSPQTQELCRGLLLQFLLDYPQGKGRLRNQMTFLANNLSYAYESGRISVMELLSAILAKFNDSLVQEYSDLFFVALVMALANEQSSKCKEMVAELLKVLISKQVTEQHETALARVNTWATQSSRPALVRVAFQTYSLIFETLQQDTKPHLPTFLKTAASTLQSAFDTQTALEQSSGLSDSMDTDFEWQSPYQALCALEKVMRIFGVEASRSLSRESVIQLLLFPHMWVRKASCRLLGSFFSQSLDPAQGQPPFSNHELIGITKQLSTQLKSKYIDDPMALQIVKNLFFIGKQFYSVKSGEDNDADTDDKQDEAEDGVEADPGKVAKSPLPWLFSKLSYQARSVYIARNSRQAGMDNWSIPFSSVIRWFAAMTNHMGAADVEKYLVHMLSPVYRLLDDESIRDSRTSEVKTLAQELTDLLQAKVGPTKFSSIYTQIRQGILNVRRERKNARVMQVVNNPEAAAKRKAHRNESKKDSRKRRDREFADTKIRNNPVKRRRVST